MKPHPSNSAYTASATLTLRQLLALFPAGLEVGVYQRRYLWGESTAHTDPAARLTRCLIKAYTEGRGYFLQGITTCADALIDGQQRLTYLALALRLCMDEASPVMRYARRPDSEAWWQGADVSSPETILYETTTDIISEEIDRAGISHDDFATYLLDKVRVLHICLDSPQNAVAVYKMINGTKSPMPARDIIKADLLRLVSDTAGMTANDSHLLGRGLRDRYTSLWDDWSRWWSRPDVRAYYARVTPAWAHPHTDDGLDLLLKLCLRPIDSDYTKPLAYDEYRAYIGSAEYSGPAQAAQALVYTLRRTQKHFEEAFDHPETYNRLKAVLLLFPAQDRYRLLRMYFVDIALDRDLLEHYYKMAFLGMSLDDILRGTSPAARFDDLYASLSMADVYHSDRKRDVFNLLLRLNIDEDIKLGRRFDFSVWDNRSLEHIYSKSKVWHLDASGRPCDGNDNPLRDSVRKLSHDPAYLCRDEIVNFDGTQLSEHCIGNLVLLYGSNNAEFGNSDFDSKKVMFLTPGDSTVFRSRNLLHSVCVFADNGWGARKIVENYNRVLRNLKTYYGQK